MASFNKVMLMGNLTRDPKLSSSVSGSSVCEFSIAINRKYTINGQEREEVCFVDIVVWGRQADSCGKYLQKGSAVFVEGRLKTDSWEDKEGKKRSRLRVVADRVQFIGSRSESNYNKTHSNEEYSEEEDFSEAIKPAKKDYSSGNQINKNEQSMPVPPQDVFEEEAEHEDDIPF